MLRLAIRPIAELREGRRGKSKAGQQADGGEVPIPSDGNNHADNGFSRYATLPTGVKTPRP